MDTSESVIFYDLEMSRKHWAYQFHNQRHSMHVRHCGKDVDVGDIPGGIANRFDEHRRGAFVLDCRSSQRRMIDVLQHLFVLIHRR